MSNTTDPESVEDVLDAPTNPGNIEAIIRAVPRPLEFAPFTDDRAPKHLALPPGWQHDVIAPVPVRTAPDLQRGEYRVFTAGGFVNQVDELRGGADEGTPIRVTAYPDHLVALINPGTKASPAFEDLTVVLRPTTSAELDEWVTATRSWFDLKKWPELIEEHMSDIDAADATSALDVLNDARTWNVVCRREVKRIKSNLGEDDDLEMATATIVGEALADFKIRIPILLHGEPLDLRVIIDRDLQNDRLKPRIPGLQRVIEQAMDREITRAETGVGVTAIR